jgi:hypothetical protein
LLDDDSNVSGSDNELQIDKDKVGNADTEDEEVDTGWRSKNVFL